MTRTTLLLITFTALTALTAAPVRAQSCAGDCDGDGAVTVPEIVHAVRIALGNDPLDGCVAIDHDGNGAVSVDELLVAVRRTLDGCGSAPTPTPTPTAVATATPSGTPPTPPSQAALAASVQIGVEPIFRILDVQESIITAVVLAGRARRSSDEGPAGGPGCRQANCELGGSLIVCCEGTELSETFDNCRFTDAGGPGTLNGQFAVSSASSVLCSGALPVDASFTIALNGFTHDVAIGGGGSFRSFHQFSETYERGEGACTLSDLQVAGLGLRGTGRRLLNGVMRRLEIGPTGGLITDIESRFDLVDVAVGSVQQGDECNVAATLAGSIHQANFVEGTQATTDYTGFQILEDPQDDGTLLLQLNGTAATDCLGDIALTTLEPLRAGRAGRCFKSGRLESRLGESAVGASYAASGGVALDFDADGLPELQFVSCTDVQADQCPTTTTALCGACATTDECQPGLSCLNCSDDCSGGTPRCAFIDTFVTCSDGVF